MNDTSAPLRPADVVMSPRRAGVAVPNALSFSRAAMRELVRDRYRIEKLRFELDDEGRGEILYRLVGGGWTFHFFLVSLKLAEEQKTDRNFAQSWDAMGVLCQGDWTAEREARLRREVPKQRSGYADYDTLIYARGNRSARLFEHVIASLAEGRQPDLELLAPIGYILRTTAFIGNGQLGTRPLEGYEPDHPLRRPYHAQFCSAFMLREYVFDLVDHLARVRGPRAVRLAPAIRRYLGLGNAAATGLVPFVVNHPHLMHRWCEVHEAVLARAAQRRAQPGDEVVVRFGALLERAVRHFRESAHPGDGVFVPPQAIADDLARLQRVVAEFRSRGIVEGRSAPQPWLALQDWASRALHPEAAETVNAILVECYPDLVVDAVDAFYVNERFEATPQTSLAVLRHDVEREYGWALAADYDEAPAQHFWYRTRKAPRDVRRGLRGRDEGLEVETSMDTVLQVQRLAACLRVSPPGATVAELLVERPDLRHIVARIQSLAGMCYAELREHWLAGAFSPFAAVRFALTFFGMEKFEAAQPKSVRGTFMQGAPIAEDVAVGRDGDWPFPLMPVSPATGDATTLMPLPASTRGSCAPPPPDEHDTVLRIAPRELARMVQNALQGHGAALGVAEDAAGLVVHAQARGEAAVAALLRQCADCRVGRTAGVELVSRDDSFARLRAGGASALLAAPAAIDLATMLAHRTGAGLGAAVVIDASDAWLLDALALRCAERGMIGLVAWQVARADDAPTFGIAVAGPDVRRPWSVNATSASPSALHALVSSPEPSATAVLRSLRARSSEHLADAVVEALASTISASDRLAMEFTVVCIRPPADDTGDAILRALSRRNLRATVTSGATLAALEDTWRQRGVELWRSEFDALSTAGEALLVPESQERRVLREGADPLKMF